MNILTDILIKYSIGIVYLVDISQNYKCAHALSHKKDSKIHVSFF